MFWVLITSIRGPYTEMHYCVATSRVNECVCLCVYVCVYVCMCCM